MNLKRIIALGGKYDLHECDTILTPPASRLYWRLVRLGILYSPLVHHYRKRWWQL